MIAEKFVELQRESWQSTWPLGFCFNASLLLAPLIRAPLDWPVSVVVGTVLDGVPHAWVETPDGDIVDPTFGQFSHGPALIVLSSDQSSEHGHSRAVVLSEREESIYRGAIKVSAKNGWDPCVDVMTLFRPNPHISPALKIPTTLPQRELFQSVHLDR